MTADDLALDGEQRTAVESRARAIAVLAGPGSGKTRVLSYRTRALLAGELSAKALLLTFTNKAAAEMKARALGVATVTSDRIWASTFHTFGMRLLYAHGDLVATGREFEVLDDEERREVSQAAATQLGVADGYSRWSYLRLRRLQVQDPALMRFASAYEALKRQMGVLDFDDLVVHAADLLERFEDVAEAYASQYPHLLVDEFQDTNASQFAIVRALARHAKTVSVFADDDQAIFRFVGAEAENVRRFISELDAVEFPLTINYRCRGAIVDCANRLIARDPLASGRQMRAFYPGGEVRTAVFDSIDVEAEALADEIAILTQDPDIRPGDVAVLGRAAYRVQPLMYALQRRGIPTSNWLRTSYETRERRALRDCLSVVRGQLTDRQAQRICAFLGIPLPEERDPLAILQRHVEHPPVSRLLKARDLAWSGAKVSEVVVAIQDAVATVDGELGSAIAPLVESIEAFQATDPDFSLDHLMAELALGGAGGSPTVGGGVKIASLHRTKGLQWGHVYLLGLEEGRLPDYRAGTTEEIREERRACFVGVCRAEHRLTLTRIRVFGGRSQAPSRFLGEMGVAAA